MPGNGFVPRERLSSMNPDAMPPADAPDEAALTWLVLLRDEAATAADRAGHAAWLAADPRHAAAWQAALRLWSELDQVGPIPLVRVVPRPQRRSRVRAVALAATVMLACVGGWWAAPPGLFADARSGVGQRQTVTLPDGSSAELATSSALSIRFTERERRVVLHRGEALFTVVRDTGMPFVVDAADGRVRVTGTVFDVKLDEGTREVAVAVVDGTVEVSNAAAGAPRRVTAGQGLRYGPAGIGVPEGVDPANATAWRDDRLVFQNVPLGQVVRDLERYRWGRILVLDDALAAIPVTGVFNTRRIDAALETIARTLPVRLIRVTDLLALITAPAS